MSLDIIDREARIRYADRRQADLKRCRESLKNKDYSVLETVGHNLKGNGISFGFPELSQLGEQMETSAKNADFFQATLCLDELEKWIDRHK